MEGQILLPWLHAPFEYHSRWWAQTDVSRRYHSLGKHRAAPLEGKRHPQTEITTTVQVSSLSFSVMAELDSFFWDITYVSSIHSHLCVLAECERQDNTHTPKSWRLSKTWCRRQVSCRPRADNAHVQQQIAQCYVLQPAKAERAAKEQASETLCKHKLKANLQSRGISFTTSEAEASAKRQIVQCRHRDLGTKQDCHCAERGAAEGSGVLKAGYNIWDASGCQTHFHQSSHKGSVCQRLNHHCCEQWAQKVGNESISQEYQHLG